MRRFIYNHNWNKIPDIRVNICHTQFHFQLSYLFFKYLRIDTCMYVYRNL